MGEPWLIALGIGAAVLLQVLQTIQIAIVGRKVSRTLAPPPLPPTCPACGAFRYPGHTCLKEPPAG